MNARTLIVASALGLVAAGCAHMSSPGEAAKAQLAPTGKVRVALLVTNSNFVNQPPGAELTGVGVDVAKAIAAHAGLPFEAVRYQSIADMLADARTGKWDATIVGIEPDRQAYLDFSPAFMHNQNSYLVPPGSALTTIADVDRKGVRITVAEKSAQHNYLQANLKYATLLPMKGNPQAVEAVSGGKAEAVAANRASLEDLAAKMPGYRVVDGSYSHVAVGVGIPKGRPAAAAYVDELVRHLRERGHIAESIARAKLRGAVVPN